MGVTAKMENTQELIDYIDSVNRKTRQYIDSVEKPSFAEDLIEELNNGN